MSIAQHNKNIKQAHKIHAAKLQPYLRQVINLIESRPRKSNFKIKFEVDALNKAWKKYCTKYQATHNDKYPNRLAFIISLKSYVKENHLLSSENFITIFE